MAHIRNSSYTDELWLVALRLPGGIEGYFERLSPMLRQGRSSPHAVAALPPCTASEFDVDSIQPCSRSN